MTEIKVDLFSGPIGSYGFRRGNWSAETPEGKIKFYASIPHELNLTAQKELLTEYCIDCLKTGKYTKEQ